MTAADQDAGRSAAPQATNATTTDAAVARRAVRAAFCATFVGIGLSRFAYSPLIPAVIAAGWFAPGEAAYLSAVNLAGYLLGAMTARHFAARLPLNLVLRALMLAVAASFAACSSPLPFAWFLVWRLIAGIAGGGLMVLATPAALALVPQARRGWAGGIVFGGVGVGIVASGVLVPPLMRLGLGETWMGIALAALLVTAVAWNGFPRRSPITASAAPARTGADAPAPPRLGSVYAAYGLNGMGLVPPMVFLVDYVARARGFGMDFGAAAWVAFGLGASLGPMAAGMAGDRFGFATTWRWSLALQILCSVVLLLPLGAIPILAVSAITGAFALGVVPIVLGRVQELLPGAPAAQARAWSLCTMAYAIAQAGAAYGCSVLLASGLGGHEALFSLGAGTVALAFLIERLMPRPRHPAVTPV